MERINHFLSHRRGITENHAQFREVFEGVRQPPARYDEATLLQLVNARSTALNETEREL